jgi:O-methyltransferase involved in polyketide biosynthesis
VTRQKSKAEKNAVALSPPSNISFTGDYHAAFKLFYNLKYAPEICSMCNGIGAFKKIYGELSIENATAIPIFEARYKSTSHALEELLRATGIKQVVELAAGMSPRGLTFSENFPDVVYLETDLEGMLEKKRRIVASLMENGIAPKRDNLKFCNLDVTKPEDFGRAIKVINPDKPVIFVAEGVLPYYPVQQKGEILDNIMSQTRKSRGLFLTPDLSFTAERQEFIAALPGHQIGSAKVQKQSGRNFTTDNLKDRAAAQKLAIEHGWVVSTFEPIPTNQIVSLKALKDSRLSRSLAENIKKQGQIWLLSLDDHYQS